MANTIYLVLVLARSILLARWLPIEVFGVYAGARAFVGLTATVPGLGMGGAFVHRAREVEDETRAATTHFTLKLLFTSVWVLLLGLYLIVFDSTQNRLAVLVIMAATAVSHLTETPNLILQRRVMHRRLALLQVLIGLLGTSLALVLGFMSVDQSSDNLALWSLLSVHVVIVLSNVFALYVWQPVWRPRLAWSPDIVRYFLRFGSQNFLATLLLQVIDKIDDLWTKAYLGNAALGFYSRSYTFATYPRELVARPVNKVSQGTYAALKNDRLALSKAFFRTNAFLVRSGFFLAGLLVLIAPEFIRIVLTDKWLPMLNVFRLMLLFTLLDPLKSSVSLLMVATGDAHRPIPARLIQLVALLMGLFWLGPRLGIEGVAIAVNVMMVIGMAFLFWQARDYVDYSPRKLFLLPFIAVAVGVFLGRAALRIPGVLGADWRTAVIKAAVFALIYGLILLLFERRETIRAFAIIRRRRD